MNFFVTVTVPFIGVYSYLTVPLLISDIVDELPARPEMLYCPLKVMV